MEKIHIQTNNAPKPGGPYSQVRFKKLSFLKVKLVIYIFFCLQAILVKNASKTLFISGQVGIDPKTNKLVDGGTKAEFEQIVKNLGQILVEVNATFR